jgi:hypothetical protein
MALRGDAAGHGGQRQCAPQARPADHRTHAALP